MEFKWARIQAMEKKLEWYKAFEEKVLATNPEVYLISMNYAREQQEQI
jgi:hypothetical protein